MSIEAGSFGEAGRSAWIVSPSIASGTNPAKAEAALP
jgi:hypothetical protein